MVNINTGINIYQDINCVEAPSKVADEITPLRIMPSDSQYEVVCPNCGRVELATPLDQFKHKCNCGYGVYVEMMRKTPS